MIINYFSILKKNTSIIEEDITEASDEEPKYDENNYLEGFKAMKFSQSVNFDDREEDIAYRNFLEKIVPKLGTRLVTTTNIKKQGKSNSCQPGIN